MSRVSELERSAIRRDIGYLQSGETRTIFPHSGPMSVVASRLDDLLVISFGREGEGHVIYKGSSIDEATEQVAAALSNTSRM